jgi:hypothetical protein
LCGQEKGDAIDGDEGFPQARIALDMGEHTNAVGYTVHSLLSWIYYIKNRKQAQVPRGQLCLSVLHYLKILFHH